MSKYSEALNELKVKIGTYREEEVKQAFDVLKEAIQKAEKYDNVPECDKCAENGVCVVFEKYANLGTYKICQSYNLDCAIREIEELKQENEELKKQIEECSTKDALFLYNNEHQRRMELQLKCKEWQEKAEKCDEEYKEHINYLEGKIKLLETSVDAFEQENQILKDGIEAIVKKEILSINEYGHLIYTFNNVREQMMDSMVLECLDKSEVKKIKAMVEVVEDEQN